MAKYEPIIIVCHNMTKYYHCSRNSDMYCLELITKLSDELVIFSDILFYYCYSNCYLYIRESVDSHMIITITLQAFRYYTSSCSWLELWYYTLYSQTNCHSY